MKTGAGSTLYPWQNQPRRRGVCNARTFYLGKLSRCSYTRVVRITDKHGDVIKQETTCCGCLKPKR